MPVAVPEGCEGVQVALRHPEGIHDTGNHPCGSDPRTGHEIGQQPRQKGTPMGNEIDRGLARLEASAKIRELANDIQLANGRLLGYAATLAGGDDHPFDEAMSCSIKACARISD